MNIDNLIYISITISQPHLTMLIFNKSFGMCGQLNDYKDLLLEILRYKHLHKEYTTKGSCI